MNEKSKDMQKFLEKVSADHDLSERLATALERLDFQQIAALAQEAGFSVTMDDLMADSNSMNGVQPLPDDQAAAVMGGSGLFTQCLLDLDLLKIIDPKSYKICAAGRR